MNDDLDQKFLGIALAEAEMGLAAGGIPIGSALVRDGQLVASGHNQRVQQGDPIAHGEMACLRNAGRQRSYRDTVLYTTLSPCMMCSGTIVQFGIPRVVVGEADTFDGNIEFLRSRGVEVVLMNDDSCRDVMRRFLSKPENLAIWNEDISED
ncbi:nucleoside deaminase [Paracoccus sp. 11-3]|uniref:Nucleoside deaminase n=1 Tax=Paracoccus amoyensis TaxID=2760093 RepID=A0A926GC73_9RHOB|nr:nucleoside deaminase [Paracoccus amoyensis]MBC9245746.1 nucleoside deaminase [Paracoccus amoyensis]